MKAFGIGLSVVAVLVGGLFIGYLLRGPTWELPQEFILNKYDVLKDTLIIVLTFAAIAIAVLGAAVYVIVRQTLLRETEQRIIIERTKFRARLATNLGYSVYKLKLLEEAIQFTKEAHDLTKGLDEKERENQRLIGAIRNNLASYFAEAGYEKDLARGYAKYIYKIRHKFPENSETWEQTYNEVLEAFPDQ